MPQQNQRLVSIIAGSSGLAALLLMLAVQVAGGMLDSGYSQVSQYISELGAVDAPGRAWINYAGFLPIGLLLGIFTAGAYLKLAKTAAARLGWILVSGISLAYLIASAAPCDPGCPTEGSVRQSVHNLGALLEYLAGSIGIAIAARSLHQLSSHTFVQAGSYATVVVVLTAFVVMAGDADQWRGAWQRVAELCLFGWIAGVSLLLLRSK